MLLADGYRHIQWRTVNKVIVAIVVTVPATALMTAGIFGFFQAAVFGASYPGTTMYNDYCTASSPGPWPPGLGYTWPQQ